MAQCLVLDRNMEERQEMKTLLSGYGFELLESGDAEAALKACRTRTPDVIVMADHVGMDCDEFIRRVRKGARGKRPVVLVYTAGDDIDHIGRAIIEGAAECLVKPFDRELLEFKLRQVGLL